VINLKPQKITFSDLMQNPNSLNQSLAKNTIYQELIWCECGFWISRDSDTDLDKFLSIIIVRKEDYMSRKNFKNPKILRFLDSDDQSIQSLDKGKSNPLEDKQKSRLNYSDDDEPL
jgi:hypothetical protein